MKLLIIVILLYSNFISKPSTVAFKFEGKWYEWYVKELKDILRNGFPSMGIPKLDPVQVNSTYSWEDPTNKINLNLRGLLSNFSNFYVNNIDIKPDLQSIIEVQFTSVSFLGNYQLNGEAMKMIPLANSGNVDIFLGNVIVGIDCKLFGSNRTVQISKFSLKYDFGISKGVGPYRNFLERIRKTLYYGNLPSTERLSLPVTELATELYSEVKTRHSVQRLRLEEASEISRNACVSPCTLVLAMIYLEQLKSSNYCYVDKVSPSDLFIVSLMVATKFLNDSGEEDDILNSEWAASVGLGISEINRLERDFLAAVNWEVFVENNSFWRRLRLLERDIALKEGNKRGWFSYTDLENLLDTINGLALAQAVFTVSAVCLASYTAGILTMLGSTLLVSQISKYSALNISSRSFTSELSNMSVPVSATISTRNLVDLAEECQLSLNKFSAKEYTMKEIIQFLKNGKLKYNLAKENNFTVYDNSYLSYVYNYLQLLSIKIEYLPLKFGRLPLDSSSLLHDCFS